MTEIAVDAAALRTSAGRMGDAAEVARSVKLGMPMSDLADAMPGSLTVASAGLVRVAWVTTKRDWAADVEAQQTSLTASADTYDGSDAASASGLGHLSGTGREPV